ncbi:hypothetical protein [Sigmofec virus UA08Rod_4774]|uniref:Uncharacterized protein n=1 Tax=Sigmofec virus UA08Rod_4774 TaxID=2929409 RepID=A0A976N216_9VIRU|nr:hypothetical protein [Sigmofec virus UA08Rod_4774]
MSKKSEQTNSNSNLTENNVQIKVTPIEGTPCAILENEKGFGILIGNQLVTPDWYDKFDKAKKRAMAVDWNLIFGFFMSLKEQEIAEDIRRKARENVINKNL